MVAEVVIGKLGIAPGHGQGGVAQKCGKGDFIAAAPKVAFRKRCTKAVDEPPHRAADTGDLSGWRICSIRGNQLHATLSGSLAAGATQVVPSQAGSNIWANNDPDDAALYNASGQLISYRRDS